MYTILFLVLLCACRSTNQKVEVEVDKESLVSSLSASFRTIRPEGSALRLVGNPRCCLWARHGDQHYTNTVLQVGQSLHCVSSAGNFSIPDPIYTLQELGPEGAAMSIEWVQQTIFISVPYKLETSDAEQPPAGDSQRAAPGE